MVDLDLRCEKCGRYLKLKLIETVIASVVCSNSKCKHPNNIKVVTPQSSDENIRFKFPKAPEADSITKDKAQVL